MKSIWTTLIGCFAVVILSVSAAGADERYAGRWEVTTSYPGGEYASALDLSVGSDGYESASDP